MKGSVYTIISLVSAIVGMIWFLLYIYERNFPFKKLSWKFAEKKAQEITSNMIKEKFSPTLIVGIGRGGAILGAMISGCLGHRPLLVIDRDYVWSKHERIEDIIFFVDIPSKFLERVLLVAGEAHTGGTMRFYHNYLKFLGSKEIRTAVLFFEEGSSFNIDYIGLSSSKKNIKMPWMFSKNYIRADRRPPKTIKNDEKEVITVYLIRHGKTKYDEEDRFCGISDPDITLEGIEQSIIVGKFFREKGIKIRKIYSSNKKRTIETAQIVQAINHFPEIIIDNRLNEINFGKWEGLPRSKVKIKFEEEYEQWQEDPVLQIPPGGESPENVLNRVLGLLKDLETSFKASSCKNIIFVTHKTPIRVLFCHLNKLPLSSYRKLEIKNGEIITLIYDGKRWRMERGDGDEQ